MFQFESDDGDDDDYNVGWRSYSYDGDDDDESYVYDHDAKEEGEKKEDLKVASLMEICEEFVIENFKDVFLEETDDEQYQSAGLKYKVKKCLHLPCQLIKNIVEKSNTKNKPILMMHLLPCMIESNKSNFQDIIFRECGGYKIDKFIDHIMTNKRPSVVSVTFPYYSNSSAVITNNIISRLPNISDSITKLELDVLFDSSNHVNNSTSSFCNSTSESTWNCPNLRQLSLSYKPKLNSTKQNLFGKDYCSSLFCNISFPPENLQELFLSSFPLDPSFLKNLKTFKNLEKLVLTKMVGGKFEEVIEAMCSLTKLKYLNFSHNKCVKEYQDGMNQQMKELLNCLPDLVHVDVSMTALSRAWTWQNMRKFSYLGIALVNDNSDDDEDEEEENIFIVLRHTEVNSILIPEYFSKLFYDNILMKPIYIYENISFITNLLCTLINRRRNKFDEYVLYVRIFANMVPLSDIHLKLFLNAFFCEDFSETLLQIRSFIYLYSLESYISSMEADCCVDYSTDVSSAFMKLLQKDNRWAKFAFGLVNLDDRLIPFITWTCRRYFKEFSQLPPFLDQFLKAVLPARHQRQEPFGQQLSNFIGMVCEVNKDYCAVIKMYENATNLNITPTLVCHSDPPIHSAPCQKRPGDQIDDPSMQPTTTKKRRHDGVTDIYIAHLWDDFLSTISAD